MTMREHRLAGIASEQHGVFTLAQANACGVPKRTLEHRVERGQYLVLHPRVFALAGSPSTWHRAVVAGVLSINSEAAVSHQTAAYLWDMTSRRGSNIEVVTTRWDRVHRSTVVVHESRDLLISDMTTLDGIPITIPTRTVVDLGASAPPWLVEACLDNGLRMELFTVDEVASFVRRVARPGRRGVGTIRPLLEARLEQGTVTESELEDLFRRIAAENGLPHPIAQYVVRDTDGSFVCRADFAYPDHSLLVELDSERYHLGRDAFHLDRAKQNRTLELGWRTLRFTWRDLTQDPARVVSTLAYMCA